MREISATLKLEGNKVTGKWGEFDVKGVFSGRNLDLDFTIYVEGVQTEGNLRIAGKLEKGKLVGSWEFDQKRAPSRLHTWISSSSSSGGWRRGVGAFCDILST